MVAEYAGQPLIVATLIRPVTGVNDAASGVVAWTNPSYAVDHGSDPAVWATVALDGDSFQDSQILKCYTTNWLTKIPAGSRITKVKVGYNRKASSAVSVDMTAKLLLFNSQDGEIVETADSWTTSSAAKTLGETDADWNGLLVPATIRDDSFGCSFQIGPYSVPGSVPTFSISFVQFEVTYQALKIANAIVS